MNIKVVIRLFTICTLAAVGWTAAFAQASALEITGAAFTRCQNGIIEGSFGVIAYDADGKVTNSVTPLATAILVYSSTGEFVGSSWDYVAGQSVAFAFAFADGFTYTDIAVEAGARSDTWRFHCNGVIENLGGGLSGLSDGRLNYYHGDLINVLYRSNVDSQPAIAVYGLDEDSNGIRRGYFTLDDIAPYIDNPPAVNTAIRTIDESTLYALTSGEFQINIGPDDEGKLYTVIFDGLPVTSVYYP